MSNGTRIGFPAVIAHIGHSALKFGITLPSALSSLRHAHCDGSLWLLCLSSSDQRWRFYFHYG
jgi:hypothetical protein